MVVLYHQITGGTVHLISAISRLRAAIGIHMLTCGILMTHNNQR